MNQVQKVTFPYILTSFIICQVNQANKVLYLMNSTDRIENSVNSLHHFHTQTNTEEYLQLVNKIVESIP